MDTYPPTAADYANANAEGAQRSAEGVAEKNRSLEQQLREQNTMLQGQISFLASIVYDQLTGQADVISNEQLDMVDRIRKLVKE